MNELDRKVVDHTVHDFPLSETDYRQLGDSGPIGQAALLLGLDETAIDSWFERFRGPASAVARVLSRVVDRDEVIDAIDAQIATDPVVLQDLVRGSMTWAHPALPQLLERPEYRAGAAWMLCQAEPDALVQWLDGSRTPEEVAETARVCGIAGSHELFEPFSEWLEPLREAGGRQAHRLEAGLFLMDPSRWSRMYLRGESDGSWFGDWVAVADALTVHAASYFSGLLAAVFDDRDAFELVARLAMAGVAARFVVQPGDDVQAILAALEAEDFGLLAAHPGFVTAAALGDEEELQIPLLESAAHDVLFIHGEDSPGIAGFPLSPTYPTDEEIAAAEELLRNPGTDPGDYLTVVGTLVDLAELAQGDPQRFAPLLDAARALRSDPRKPVARAAHRLFEQEPVSELARQAVGEDIRAYDAAERLARRADEPALLELIDLWAEAGSLLRVPLYSALTYDVMRHLVALPQE